MNIKVEKLKRKIDNIKKEIEYYSKIYSPESKKVKLLKNKLEELITILNNLN